MPVSTTHAPGQVITSSDINALASLANTNETGLTTKAAAVITIRTVTASTTLTATDEYVRVNLGTATTVTVPTNAATARAIGTVVQVRQVGAGQVTIAGAGVTFSGLLKTSAQNTSVTLIKTGTDAWDAEGGIA